MASNDLSGRDAARARREAKIQGKSALPGKGARGAAAPVRSNSVTATTSGSASANSGREAAQARRLAMSARGKAGVDSIDRQNMVDTMIEVRGELQKTDCGCDGHGDCGGASAEPVTASVNVAQKAQQRRSNEVKTVTATSAGRMNSKMRRQVLSIHGKTGADSYRKGMSAAQMVRHQNPEISGRELAKTVRALRANGSHNGMRSAPVGRRRPERPAGDVTGTGVSHSDKTTGDEIGLCRTITGTEYLSSDVFEEFCQNESPRFPRKVAVTETLRGGRITSGGATGRSQKVTGDERGSCHPVTGSEYVGREQFDDFCQRKPEPGSAKVSFSQTTRGQIISGSKSGRARQVTGNESGTCKVVTGTPYAGVDQFRGYCGVEETQLMEARSIRRAGNAGRDISGLQPGLSGLTGAEKGACRTVSGTAYIGATDNQEVCGLSPAQPGESDFPRPIVGAPWSAFSIAPPGHASQQSPANSGVTGTRYEQGRISGTFSLAEGKVTGTEQFRFGDQKSSSLTQKPATLITADKVSRVTGEGIDIGLKITGDDWNRGERVTGTEGSSAVKRNPTRRGPVSAMPAFAPKRNEDLEPRDAKVTGSSGNTEKGAVITVSGGARG